jgi:hypothetical protein
MQNPLFNYNEITEILISFFKDLNYNAIITNKLITNINFNYGLSYSLDNIIPNTYKINKTSRVEDIKTASNICVLPLFHIFGSSLSLKLLVDLFNYLIKSLGLDVSKINLETSVTLEPVVNILKEKCNISNIDYYSKNISMILNDGRGSLIFPIGALNSKIYPAIRVNYILDDNKIQIIEIFQKDKNMYVLEVGIERLYTAVNYHLPNIFIPNWSNTLPFLKLECENEVKEYGVSLPLGYELLVNTDPIEILQNL